MKFRTLFLLLFAPALHAQSAPAAATFFTDAELRHAINTSPQESPELPNIHMLRLSPKSQYPIMGVRSSMPGEAEVHGEFTDVWYVLDGAATMVTGGTVAKGTSSVPGEIRGPSIENGISRVIRKGELAIVPAGTPHWISSIVGKEFVYMVIKVPTSTGKSTEIAQAMPDSHGLLTYQRQTQ